MSSTTGLCIRTGKDHFRKSELEMRVDGTSSGRRISSQTRNLVFATKKEIGKQDPLTPLYVDSPLRRSKERQSEVDHDPFERVLRETLEDHLKYFLFGRSPTFGKILSQGITEV